MFSRLQIETKVLEYLHLTVLHVFYMHIKIQGLSSDMLTATQNISWKYACDMLIIYVSRLFFKAFAKIFS